MKNIHFRLCALLIYICAAVHVCPAQVVSEPDDSLMTEVDPMVTDDLVMAVSAMDSVVVGDAGRYGMFEVGEWVPVFGDELQQEMLLSAGVEVQSCVLRDAQLRPQPYPRNGYYLPPAAKWRGEPVPNIYFMPYSKTASYKDWKRLWINTGVLTGAFVGTLFVLECLPEDATSWNRAELQKVPLFTRWKNHVIDEGPEWDHDKVVFNYVLHPYAGAAYFMAARSCGFNFWQSLLYSACISTIGWEFGIEAFMERPSIQDIFVTPLVGSVLGECFYGLKRYIVHRGYTLFGSAVLGNIVAFICDPVNEVIGLFAGNPSRKGVKYLKDRGFNLRSKPWKIKDPHGFGSAYGIAVNLEF